jgi:hypothetical protein
MRRSGRSKEIGFSPGTIRRTLLSAAERFHLVLPQASLPVYFSLRTIPRTVVCSHFAVGQRPRWSISQVVHRHLGRKLAAHGTRRQGKEFVARAAFVRFDMRKRGVPKRGERQHLPDGLADEREHLPRLRMKHERLVVGDQVLVEIEPTGTPGKATGVLIQ